MAGWSYLHNMFINATRHSHVLMLVLGNDHQSKLKAQQADPDIAVLEARTAVLHTGFVNAYSSWKNALATRKGASLLVKQRMNELRSLKIKQWDVQIQVQHLEGTSEYMALLPNRRGPFQKGGIDVRIEEVAGLANRLANFPALAATKADVEAYNLLLVNARDAQQQKEQLIAQTSDDLDVARIALARMMYGNLGVLMDKYRDAPDYINNFWEVSLIQNTPPPVRNFKNEVAGNSTISITATVGPNASVVLSNTGNTSLTFCLAGTNDTACDSGVTVFAGDTKRVERSVLGDDVSPFLNVTNTSIHSIGSYDVEVIG